MAHGHSRGRTRSARGPGGASRWELLGLFVAVTPLLLLAIRLGAAPLSTYQPMTGPATFVSRSQGVVSGTAGAVDSPLSYLSVGLLSWLLEPAAEAPQVASTAAALCCFVVTPLVVWAFARRVADARVAMGSLFAVVLMRALGYATTGYYLGNWPLDFGQPLALLALLAAHVALVEDRRGMAAAAGVLVGLLSLVHLGVAAVAAAVVAVAFARRGRWRWLGLATLLSSLPLLYHVLTAPGAAGLVDAVAARLLPLGPANYASSTLSEALGAPETVLTLALFVAAVGTYRWGWEPRSSVLDAGVGVYAFGFPAFVAAGVTAHQAALEQVGPFLLVVVVAGGAIRLLDRVSPDAWHRATVHRPRTVTGLAVALLFVVGFVLFALAPTNLPA